VKVIAIATISVDGRITPPDAEGTPFSSPETGSNFVSVISTVGAVVSGRRTYDVVKDEMEQFITQSDGSVLNLVMTREPSGHEDQSQPDGLEFTREGPSELIGSLKQRGIQSIAIAGGGEIYAAFAAEQLIDEWIIAVEPLILGGGKPLLGSAAQQQLALEESRHLNDNTVLLRYRVEGPSK
jgi:dihydrofolate reductase